MPAPRDLAPLIHRARRGDRDALGMVWQACRRFVATVLLAHADRRAIDDLLQEVALRVTGGLDGLADADRLLPWLRTIARNVAIDHGRRVSLEAPRCAPDHAENGLGDPFYDPAQQQRHHDDLHAVLHDLAQLEPIYREPLLLRAVEGLSQREIADALDVPETTVETRIARARRLLRERHEAHPRPTAGDRHDARERRTVDQPGR
ncbi:MAG: RNA polymerase sigma factor [Planctomycetes bacterium]|nr:RNA polymerase sigma factor [Planctomycetota bacterium]